MIIMTQEEKAKAYDEAIKVAKSKIKNDKDHVLYEDDIIEIFPELKESEDERIRKALINYFKYGVLTPEHPERELIESWIAWLEEKLKGEQKTNPCDGCINRKGCINCENGELRETEQKTADKVEPKFKVGDWVVSPNGVYWHIDAINNNRYIVSSTDGACADWPLNTNLYHLWTIEDAKEGDVLVHNGCTFIFMGIKDGIVQAIEKNILEIVPFGEPDKDTDYHPATKEQYGYSEVKQMYLFFKRLGQL